MGDKEGEGGGEDELSVGWEEFLSDLRLRCVEFDRLLRELASVVERAVGRFERLSGSHGGVVGLGEGSLEGSSPVGGGFSASVRLPRYIPKEDLVGKEVFDDDLRRVGRVVDWTYDKEGRGLLVVAGGGGGGRLGIGESVLIPFDYVSRVGGFVLLDRPLDVGSLPRARSRSRSRGRGYTARLRLPRYIPKEDLAGKEVHDARLSPVGEAVDCTYTADGYVGLVVVGRGGEHFLKWGERVTIPLEFIEEAEDIILLSKTIDSTPLPQTPGTPRSQEAPSTPEVEAATHPSTPVDEASKATDQSPPPGPSVSGSLVSPGRALDQATEEAGQTRVTNLKKISKYVSTTFPIVPELTGYLISFIPIIFGMCLFLGGIFIMISDAFLSGKVSGMTDTIELIAFVIDSIPGVPLPMTFFSSYGFTFIGLSSLIIGLETLLVGVGLWKGQWLAKWVAIVLYLLSAFFDFIQVLLKGLIGAPWSVIGLILNAFIIYLLYNIEIRLVNKNTS